MSLLFRGLHSITLDAKGRMAIPARFRGIVESHCQGQLVVTIDQDGESLVIYPLNEFVEIERKVAALSSFHPESKRLKNIFIGHATEVNLDSSSRILIPLNLREFVGLDKKAALVGQGNKLAIWNDEAWNKTRDNWLKHKVNTEELPDELRNLSL
ncbi:MAG: division/cell wall cluster transcriptional repressor MraZ [Pseudohongiellaceae bacterium]